MKSNYGFIARIYDPIFYLALKPIRIAVMNELLKYKGKIILDLCCGTGNQFKLLSKHGFRNLYCLDISDSMLEIAKRSDSSIKIYNEDATKTFMLVVDYVFDNKTTKFSRILISIIERIAGSEHYRNFKNYIQNKGLLSLIKKDKFKLTKCNRMSSGAVTISIYRKILLF
ncbi:2-methoxy-6-polyprenyl-1,4-benzoquinol methylase, mitochondrial [subsurface metagenome]